MHKMANDQSKEEVIKKIAVFITVNSFISIEKVFTSGFTVR